MKFKAVLFDFDGTVADTGEGIFESAQYAVQKLGKEPLELSTLQKFIGPPLVFSFQEYAHLSKEDADKAVELYREHYSGGGLFKLRFYDGLLDLLKLLRENGIYTGVASAKPDVFIQRILEHYQIDSLFDCAKGISLSDYCTDKAGVIQSVLRSFGEIDPKDVLMVGDKNFDILGAKAIGAHNAGVLFGYGTKEELVEAGAEFLAEDIAALKDYIFS